MPVSVDSAVFSSVWVVPSSGELDQKQMKAMDRMAPMLRYDLAKDLSIKKLPTLRFCKDTVTLEQERVATLLHDLFPNGDDAEED